MFPHDMDLLQLSQHLPLWEIHHRALHVYDPPAESCPIPITLFNAAEEQPSALLDLLRINLKGDITLAGWQRLSTAPVKVYTTPGTHYVMLNDPYVRDVAKIVNESIALLCSKL